ncbi:MAG: hypothetical protein ACE5JK_04475, partial [Candidatus Omnitrophota bacterium]
IRLFSLCQLALAFILPATLFAIRSCKAAMDIATGEIIGYYPMALAAFVILGLSCTVMGFMFSLGCRVYRSATDIPAERVAHVYILEAVGALSGGFLVSYFLIRFMIPFGIIFILAFLNVLASLAMQRHGEGIEPGSPKGTRFTAKALYYGTITILIIGFIATSTGGVGKIRQYSLDRLWTGFDVLESRDSVYGNIAVTQRGGQRSFYDNGLHLYTVPDLLSAEEAVHFALLENNRPEKVLLIGGGVGGLLREILKYPVRRVDYVELDPAIIEMAREYLSGEDSSFLDSPKVNIINEDGRFYTKRAKDSYDCVIINLGDPYTAQLNRFYTIDFFKEVSRILNEGGVVSFGLTSSENYIGEELRDYLRSIYLSAKEVFPDVIILPGDTAYFIASNKAGMLTSDSKVLMDRMKERGVEAKYVREYYLLSKLSEERVDYAKRTIEEDIPVISNRDFSPISYYYATVFWGTHFDTPVFRRLLRMIVPGKIWLIAVLFCVFISVLCLWNRKRRSKRSVLLAVMTTGFAEINFQIAVILSFQVIYGFVFYKLGVIITSFMVGLALGGWLVAKHMPRIKDDMALFSWTQLSICIYPLILPVIFLLFSRARSDAVVWLGANIVFPFLPIIAGTIGGIQFPLANKIYLEHKGEMGRVAGLTYGVDLLGACLGSLLAAAFLVPVLGVFQTCFLVALINVIVLALLLISYKTRP